MAGSRKVTQKVVSLVRSLKGSMSIRNIADLVGISRTSVLACFHPLGPQGYYDSFARRNGYSSHSEYKMAMRDGEDPEERSIYFKKWARRNGYKSPSDYRENWAKSKGYSSFYEYRKNRSRKEGSKI